MRKGTKCHYTPKWKDLKDMPDSRGFRDKEKINLASSVECKDFHAHGLRIGLFSVDSDGIDYSYDKMKYTDLYKNQEFIPPHDIDGTWRYYPEKARLLRKKIPGHDNIGDLRVTFYCLKRSKSSAVALGIQSQDGNSV